MTIRLLIVDDSSFIREVLRDVLAVADDICVVGEASDARSAFAQIERHKPDVITMDVLMPMMNGLDAVREIVKKHAIPIVVVADTKSSGQLRSDAIKAGAVEVFPKPQGGFDEVTRNKLIGTIRRASVREVQRTARSLTRIDSPPDLSRIQILGIVASTGGPQTLSSFLSKLPRSIPFPVVVVQHTTSGYTSFLRQWLAGHCQMKVRIAENNRKVEAGEILIAPDDLHLRIGAGGIVSLGDDAPVASLRPAGDVLFQSLASAYKRRAAGLVCTGMGRDGSQGLGAIASAGGVAMVQHPDTAVLASMPQNALNKVAGASPVHLDALAQAVRIRKGRP